MCLEILGSVQFSCSVMSDSVTPWTAALQASLSITNSQSLLKLMFIESVMPSNHLILYVSFCSCLQSFPASGSFQMSQLFTSGGQSIGVSASTSVLPMNIQDWFPLGWTGWISLQSKGPSRVLSNTTVQKAVLNGLLYCSKLFWTPLVQVEKPHLWKQKSSHRLRVSHSTQDGQCASKSIYLGLKSFQTLSPSLLLPGYLFHSFPSSCHSLAFFPSLIIMMENIVMRGLRFVSY